MRIADDGEIQFRGPTRLQRLLERARARRPRPSPTTAGTGPATSATSTTRAGSILSGRIKDIIVLPNGFNVYPEDIENALRIAGIRDSVVARDAARPDRGGRPRPASAAAGRPPAREPRPRRRELRARIDAAVKAANATLGPNQRIAGWRLWPDDDFPRTHTLKVKRDPVRAWAAVDAPLPVGRRRADRRPQVGTGNPDAERLERGLDRRGRPGPCAVAGQPRVEDDRRADLADDVTVAVRRLDAARAGREVAACSAAARGRAGRCRGTRRRR